MTKEIKEVNQVLNINLKNIKENIKSINACFLVLKRDSKFG